MPRPRAFKQIKLDSTKLDESNPTISSDTPAGTQAPKRVDQAAVVARRAIQGMADAEHVTLDKHSEKLRYKIAYSAHRLAEELAIVVSSKSKKDKEYIKGLVWSLGVLYDKLAASDSGSIAVRIPSKLLENVKVVIALQAEKKAKPPVDITPTTPTQSLDSVSSDTSIKS